MEKNEINQTTLYSRETSDLSGYKEIAIAIIQLMMKDLTIPDSKVEIGLHDSKAVIGWKKKWKKKKKGYKRSAYCFVRSEWFEDLCWYIGVNPDPIRAYAIERYNESKKK